MGLADLKKKHNLHHQKKFTIDEFIEDADFYAKGKPKVVSLELNLHREEALTALAFIESGASWLVALAERMDEVCEAHANFVFPKLSRKPSQIIDDQVWASFQHDRACITAAAAGLPGARNVMWGSDYPHAEGTFPISRKLTEELFAGLDVSDSVRTDILGLNGARLFGIEPVVSTSSVLLAA